MIKVAITGPESTGKSALSESLAKYYHTEWVPEYAREYIDQLERPYMEADLFRIAQKQMESEDEACRRANKILFADTDLTVLKIWSIHKYKRVHPWIHDEYKTRTYDHVFLMNIDIPWEYDHQRENPHLRTFFFEWYQRELESKGVPYTIISGADEDRVKNAIKVCDQLLNHA